MNKLGARIRAAALTVAALIGSGVPASAAPLLFALDGTADGSPGATVLFDYTGLTESTGQVNVTLSNTSAAYDPRLTAFAFNLPDSVLGVTSFHSSLGRWHADHARDGIDTPGQFGSFDVAALTGHNFNGGSPRKGLERNGSADFSFVLVGTGMLGLDENAFLSLGSHGRLGDDLPFAVRFQQVGRGGDGSDVGTPSASPTASVPEPATALLSGVGLLVLVALARRRTALRQTIRTDRA